MSEKENKMVRFPRPMGTTAMALEYQKNPNDELLIKIDVYKRQDIYQIPT